MKEKGNGGSCRGREGGRKEREGGRNISCNCVSNNIVMHAMWFKRGTNTFFLNYSHNIQDSFTWPGLDMAWPPYTQSK